MKRSILVTIFAVVILFGCGESEKEKADRLHADSVAALKPRQDIYDAAVGLAKENLKAPSTARFAKLKMQNDSVSISMHGKDTAIVYSTYEAQNSYGVFLAPEHFKVILARKDGKWKPAHGETFKFMDVRMKYYAEYDNDILK